MKAVPQKNKDGDIISYKFWVFIGRDEFNKTKFKTKTWRIDKKYTPKQLEKEVQRQQVLFEQEVMDNVASNSIGLKVDIKTTFKEFSDYWIKQYSLPNNKTKTTTSYESMLKRIDPAIGDISIGKITPLTINSFINNLSEDGVKLTDKTHKSGLAPKSIKNYYILLSSIFHTAVKWHIIKPENNPMIGVNSPKFQRKPIQALSKDEAISLLSLLEEHAPMKYNLFIKTALLTGMRRGEICGLKWCNIDFDNQSLHIKETLLYDSKKGVYLETPKTQSSNRSIKLPKDIIKLFKQYKKEQDEIKQNMSKDWNENGYVFIQDNGKPMHPNTPYTWFTRFQKRNNLKPCSIHALRHTAATLLILNGTDIKSVSGRLGHAYSGTTVDTYGFYLQSADEMVTDTLSNILDTKDKV